MVAWWWLLIVGFGALFVGGYWKHDQVEMLEAENSSLQDENLRLRKEKNELMGGSDEVKDALITLKKFLKDDK
jgi:hypothetical protein